MSGQASQPSMASPPHLPTLPEGAECEVVHNLQEGRHLVATRTIAAGSVVFSELPYVYTVQKEHVKARCHFCLRLTTKALRCGQCKAVYYCGRHCQRAAWSASHALVCPLIVQCRPQEPTPTLIMTVRYLLRREQELALGITHESLASTRGDLNSSTAQGSSDTRHTHVDVEAMPTHRTDASDEKKESYAQMAMLAVKMLTSARETGEGDVGALIDTTIDFFCRLACNAHTICDSEMKPLGTGLYVCAALLNHSCRPTVVCTYEGPRLVVRALEKIHPGQAITISYIELAETTARRRVDLQQRYYFTCQCERCTAVDNDPTYHSEHLFRDVQCPSCLRGTLHTNSDPGVKTMACGECGFIGNEAWTARMSSEKKQALSYVATAQDALGMGDVPDCLRYLRSALEIADKYHSEVSLERTSILNQIVNIAINAQDWNTALEAAIPLVTAQRIQYDDNSPILGLQLVMLGKLHAYKGGVCLPKALASFERALPILTASHGSTHELVAQVRRQHEDVAMELRYGAHPPGVK